jgi:hypothetical protein
MSQQIFIVDGPGPEWVRTFIADNTNDANDAIFVASSAVTADLEDLVRANATRANVPVIIRKDHIYVPVRWLASEYPQSGNLCATLERRARDHIGVNQRASQQPVIKVRVQIAPIICFKCEERIKAVRGYVYGNAFVALENVSDRRQLAALIEDLRKHDTAITPVGSGFSETIDGRLFAARCPECSIICSNFFMTAEFFKETVHCHFPNCGCDYPNVQCRGFEYYPVSLRIGRNELQFIAHQTGPNVSEASSVA